MMRTDAYLIQEYQNTQSDKIYKEIYNRYEGFIVSEACLLQTRVKDNSLGLEDHIQEMQIRLLNVIRTINTEKIKNTKKFKLALSLRFSINNYKSGVYRKANNNNCLNYIDTIKNYSTPDNIIESEFLSLIQDKKNIETKLKFLETLKKKEQTIFIKLIEGEKIKNIAKELSVTSPLITYYKKRLNNKYQRFCYNKIFE